MWARPDAGSGPAWLDSFKETGGEAWWWLRAAGAGREDTGSSGPEASRGVSEGLATKEGWQQVGWGHPAHLPDPSDLPCLSHGLSAHPGCTPSPRLSSPEPLSLVLSSPVSLRTWLPVSGSVSAGGC